MPFAYWVESSSASTINPFVVVVPLNKASMIAIERRGCPAQLRRVWLKINVDDVMLVYDYQ